MGEEVIVTKNTRSKKLSMNSFLTNGKLHCESAKALYKTAVLEIKQRQFMRLQMQLMVLG